MKKILRLTETDLTRIVKRILQEQINYDDLGIEDTDDESIMQTKVSAMKQRRDIADKFKKSEQYPITKQETYDLISLAQDYCKKKDWSKDPYSMRCDSLRKIVKKLENAYKTSFLKPPSIFSDKNNQWG